SRRRHTRFSRDWSSDVCSSDLFKLDKFLPGEEISFVRNDDYVDGPPHLDGLKFVYIPGGPATYETFQSGGIHVGLVNDRPTVSRAEERRVGKDGAYKGQYGHKH